MRNGEAILPESNLTALSKMLLYPLYIEITIVVNLIICKPFYQFQEIPQKRGAAIIVLPSLYLLMISVISPVGCSPLPLLL